MADYEKVIKGLECCTHYGSMCGLHCDGYAGWTNGTIVQYKDHHEECPYFKCETGCAITLAKDALELLKEYKRKEECPCTHCMEWECDDVCDEYIKWKDT